MRFEQDNLPHRIPEFIASGTAIAIGAGVTAASTAGKIIAGNQQANALEKAGRSELEARKEALRQQIQERQRIEARADEAAKPSLREIEATNRLIADNDRAISTAFNAVEKEIATLEEATDPAIKAAGENLTKLLEGKAAQALAPIQKQRARQRAELENQLKARFGSGFRTTTAGIQALQGFDDQTDLLAAQTQTKALTSLSGTLSDLAGARRAGVAGATKLVGNVSVARSAEVRAEQVFGQRRANAAVAGLGSQVNFGQVADAAAAPFAGDIASAQTFGDVAGQFGQIGGQFLGGGFGKAIGLGDDATSDLIKSGGAATSASIGKVPSGGRG